MAKLKPAARSKEPQLKCPTCKGPVAERGDNPNFPFCSERCKAVDLAKWFTGAYAVPGAAVRSDDEEAAPLSEDEKQ